MVTPVPKPDVLPVPVSGLRVLILSEQFDTDDWPESQVAILTSTVFREWLRVNKAQVRILDQNAKFTDDPAVKQWRDFFNGAKAQNKPLPWIWAAKDGKQIDAALPLSDVKTMAYLEESLLQ